MTVKICNTCLHEKDESYFYNKDKTCKECRKIQVNQRYLKKTSNIEHLSLMRSRGACPEGYQWCGVCNKYLSLENFLPSHHQKRCRQCASQYDKKRAMRLKKQSIEHLGGKCHRCGWIGHWAAYDFHHTDPSKKEMSWDKLRKKTFEKIKAELSKCVLLCRNCHTIIHCSLDEEGNNNEEYCKSGSLLA